MADEPPATTAVPFDPFADDDDVNPGTEAVQFDPFADDDEDELEDSDIADLLHDLGELRDQHNRESTSEKSRQEAISTFRSRHGTARSSRPVADGMVELPFIPPTSADSALLSQVEIAKEKHQPQLHPGDIVADQYVILGVLGHGGMGWIYLARDHFVSERLVILKGMQAEKSADETAAAGAEREFLAGITHPGIVKIYNFIDDERVPGGFIVMEFVGGPSLRSHQKKQENKFLPIDIAIGYILEVLPAMDYLHSRGVVYNDLKPDNIIITEDQVKLIDLGAVSGIGAYGFIYGTKGFQAPEVATEGPSVASDIYTIGRTLAALTITMPVADDGSFLPGLPSPSNEPTLRRFLSYFRLLERATNPDPARRFANVKELETELYGVLREVIALRDGRKYPSQHSRFSPQRTTFGTKHLVFRTDQLIDGIERTIQITPDEVVSALPTPLIDRSDIGAAMLSGSSYTEPEEALETLRQAMLTPEYEHSAEIPLGVVHAMLDLGLTTRARNWLLSLGDRLSTDWRFQWYSGITDLLLDDFVSAQRHFNEVLAILPGEAAPKLALAAVDELILQERGLAHSPLLNDELAKAASGLNGTLGDVPNELFAKLFTDDDTTWSHITSDAVLLRFHAIRLYGMVWGTNPTTVSSAFGLSRQLIAENLTELGVTALDRVPQASRHHRMATLTSILELTNGELTESRIRRAARRLEQVPPNEPRLMQIKIAVMTAALEFLSAHGIQAAASKNRIFDVPFSQTGLRYGLSDALREQARLAPSAKHRYALVDMANQVRPETWF